MNIENDEYTKSEVGNNVYVIFGSKTLQMYKISQHSRNMGDAFFNAKKPIYIYQNS